jgi:hypothetical protein
MPKARKAPRTVFAEVQEAKTYSEPVTENLVETIEPKEFFGLPEIEAEPKPFPSFANIDSIDLDESPLLPRRPQTADGTFGDDLDIPEFLRG